MLNIKLNTLSKLTQNMLFIIKQNIKINNTDLLLNAKLEKDTIIINKNKIPKKTFIPDDLKYWINVCNMIDIDELSINETLEQIPNINSNILLKKIIKKTNKILFESYNKNININDIDELLFYIITNEIAEKNKYTNISKIFEGVISETKVTTAQAKNYINDYALSIKYESDGNTDLERKNKAIKAIIGLKNLKTLIFEDI